MKCTICIDPEADECQVISALVAVFFSYVLAKKNGSRNAPVNKPLTVLRHYGSQKSVGCFLYSEKAPQAT